ncbi:adenosine deaminase [Streptococcus agalactiae]|uniref:Adenosine deaminase n=1 Tax=Streptococcus agalactiae TaxID=1311 RepID=A0A837KZQ2_STRAG|nr:adenosine deaminase [Streptococcus agalactiae]EPT36183.1 adenosine deaminase [Streptococcus agalactiae FSL S3-277]EPT42276.1 adenosine deaminase [Streptococcus agalactiae FSL S3-603]EPU45916.1 adenosine deaminase [Streptococcus agalactiae LDS 628]EPV89941.1 adenosine deaminase [Streptococcus agalactiae FSL S3-105]EPX17232.1 adenosine deaminase [Streptococcus agalactiae LDS 623]
MTQAVLKELAKAELHCHLDGSLSLPAIRKLANMADIILPNSDKELRKYVIAPAQTESLVDYLKTFEFIRPLLQTKEALRFAAYDVARQAALENVIYIEIRFAPELSMDKGLTASDTVFAVLEGLADAQKEFNIVARALVCGMRQSSHKTTKEIIKHIVDLAPKGLVGFDFAGDEFSYPTDSLVDLIQEVKRSGYPMTLHAGECGCAKHIADSLNLGIKRMGHVTALTGQRGLIKRFVEEDAVAEMCLTSNLQTKAASSIQSFPYQELYDAGGKITINTDNRTVSDTNLTKEYSLFVTYFGTKIEDFLVFNQNAVKASFTSDSEKDTLLHKLQENYDSYLK